RAIHSMTTRVILALLAALHVGAAPAQPGVDLEALQAIQNAQVSREQVAAAQSVAPEPETTTDAAALLGTVAEDPEQMMFGEQLFRGAIQNYGASFNADYTLAIGDRVTLRMWGAFTFEAIQVIDAQGNVFVPNVGPIRLAGVRNSDINEVVRAAVEEVYRSNVDVYASLEASQPVRVFVTGFVRAPGQYPGVAAESVLGYLARAGGVDPERGSYIDVRLLRGGQERARFDLYDFLLEGRLDAVQVQEGDTVVVGGRHNAVRVTGDVFNAFAFEFDGPEVAAADILDFARPRPGATHVSIVRKVGIRQFAEYHAIDALDGVMLGGGDDVSVVSDRTIETILVRVDGAIGSSRILTLPYGSRLREAFERIRPLPQAQPAAVQLFRQSVAERQREMLEVSLRTLETHALTARSSTNEEASLRAQEAQRITRFIERARSIEPRGQVVLGQQSGAMDTLLEDGDIIVIPEQSSLVMVHGEVTQPNAIAYDPDSRVEDYVRLAGGTTQRSKNARILLVRQDGTFVDDTRERPRPGDEILVLPVVGSKNVEVTRGISTILYQLAIAAKVVLDL
ncbi:MAG TPA: polysaccharide biosynthesis/export family protein, partial [Gammaproteobacteria bacterium]|nr:polysaccharide biosynthesis/export family protein [Gammaproteobacteria bacterium]